MRSCAGAGGGPTESDFRKRAAPSVSLRPNERRSYDLTRPANRDGNGTLVATFAGTRCPLGDGGHATTVDFSWTIDGGVSTGTFAGSAGGGTGRKITAGNVQVVSLTGTITLA